MAFIGTLGTLSDRGGRIGEECSRKRLAGKGVRTAARTVVRMEAGGGVGEVKVEKTREQELKELAELAKVEEKYGRQGYLSDEDVARLRDEGVREYNKLIYALLGDSLFLGGIGASLVSMFYPINSVLSYGIGVVGSIIYVLLLSRSVDRLATSARAGNRSSDILGPARFLVLVVIVLFIAKYQEKTGLQVIPATIGFLSYKLALFIPLLSGEEVLDI